MVALTPRFLTLVGFAATLSLGVSASPVGPLAQLKATGHIARAMTAPAPAITNAAVDESSPANARVQHHSNRRASPAPAAAPVGALAMLPIVGGPTKGASDAGGYKDDTVYLNTPVGNKEVIHNHSGRSNGQAKPKLPATPKMHEKVPGTKDDLVVGRSESPIEQEIKHGNYVKMPKGPRAMPKLPVSAPKAPVKLPVNAPRAAPALPVKAPVKVPVNAPRAGIPKVTSVKTVKVNARSPKYDDNVVDLGAPVMPGLGLVYHDHQEAKRANKDEKLGLQESPSTGVGMHDHQTSREPKDTDDNRGGAAVMGSGVAYHHYEQGRSFESEKAEHQYEE
ncbi:hypothetical protein PLICRDRAFT_30851 [Plicaturopsis crispa FD-325 SS-3]|nr:hypothetical protein PLICRDRAFT_30851 [Plicaturopsis crispa FD-325 SS-3]